MPDFKRITYYEGILTEEEIEIILQRVLRRLLREKDEKIKIEVQKRKEAEQKTKEYYEEIKECDRKIKEYEQKRKEDEQKIRDLERKIAEANSRVQQLEAAEVQRQLAQNEGLELLEGDEPEVVYPSPDSAYHSNPAFTTD